MRCYNEDLENHQEFCKAGKMLQPMSIEHAFPQKSIFESVFETSSERQHLASIAPKGATTSGHGAVSRHAKTCVSEVRQSKEKVRSAMRPEGLHQDMSNLRVGESNVCSKSAICDSPKRKKRPDAERRKKDKLSDRRQRVPDGSKSHRVQADATSFAATRPERTGRQDKKLRSKVPETNCKNAPDARLGSQKPLLDPRALKRAVPMSHVESAPVSPHGPEYRSSRAPFEAPSSIKKQAMKSKRRKSSMSLHAALDQAALVSDSSASDLSKSSPSPSRRRREPAVDDSTRYFWKDPGLTRPTTPKGILKKSSTGELRDCVANSMQLELTKNDATTIYSARSKNDTHSVVPRETRKKSSPRRRI